jgi:hypothetical protein
VVVERKLLVVTDGEAIGVFFTKKQLTNTDFLFRFTSSNVKQIKGSSQSNLRPLPSVSFDYQPLSWKPLYRNGSIFSFFEGGSRLGSP